MCPKEEAEASHLQHLSEIPRNIFANPEGLLYHLLMKIDLLCPIPTFEENSCPYLLILSLSCIVISSPVSVSQVRFVLSLSILSNCNKISYNLRKRYLSFYLRVIIISNGVNGINKLNYLTCLGEEILCIGQIIWHRIMCHSKFIYS